MKIVLAIDSSEFSKAAVKELAKMPLPNDSEVSIITVYEYPTIIAPEPIPMEGFSSVYYEEIISNTKENAEEIVSEAVKTLKEKHSSIAITTDVVSGLPKREILEKAEAFDADLIVVGSQGQGAFSRFLLGSVSQYLATHAKCSVLIVKEKDEK